ncbi:hypothetical protein ACLIYN_22535, partial [Streptomyces atacamensis]
MDDETGTGAGTGAETGAARLAEAMRREAGTLVAGPPPVEALVREGRRLARRRRGEVLGQLTQPAGAVLGERHGAGRGGGHGPPGHDPGA